MTYQELYAGAEHLYAGFPMHAGQPFVDQPLDEQLRFVNMAAEIILMRQYFRDGLDSLPEDTQRAAYDHLGTGNVFGNPLYGRFTSFEDVPENVKVQAAAEVVFADRAPHAYQRVLDQLETVAHLQFTAVRVASA